MTSPQVVPQDFAAEAEQSFAANDRAHLILQSWEVEGFSWEAAGKALTKSYLAKITPPAAMDRVVLFAGHRIDSPGRATPRFPADAEPPARAAIVGMLKREQLQGQIMGMAGGANGGDILFLEACRELGIPFHMLLALPEGQFVPASVAAPTGNWVERFQSLAHESRPRVLGHSKDLPAWLQGKRDYNFWARNNLWMISSALALAPRHFIMAALWDGQKGDGAGGTENMVEEAKHHGAQFIHLDMRELLRDRAIRSARL